MLSLAPQFCGSHLTDGKDWSHCVILEDLCAGFSKPNILDLQVGQRHVGSCEAGSATTLGLRMNGTRRHTVDGPVHRNKEWSNTLTTHKFPEELENFLTDSSGTLRAEVAGTVLQFLDQLEPWVMSQTGIQLLGTSLLVVYEGDVTVVNHYLYTILAILARSPFAVTLKS